MKASIIALATVFALSSTFALAQNGSGVTANAKTRSAMNSIPAKQQHRHMAHNWAAKNGAGMSRLNGHGIDSLGVTTNSGRKYNGA